MSYEVTLLWTAAVVTVLSAGIVLVAVRRRRGTGELTKVETYLVSLVGAGAMLGVLGSVLAIFSGGWRAFGENPYSIDDMPYGGGPVRRVEDVADVVDSNYSSARLVVLDVPTGSRWLFFIELALPALAGLAVCVAVAWLTLALLRGRPFVRALPGVIAVAAISLMVGSLGSQFAGAFARSSVIDYLGVVAMTGTEGGPAEGFSYFALGLDTSAIAWAFALGVVAAAFQIGTRMQRETEGLV